MALRMEWLRHLEKNPGGKERTCHFYSQVLMLERAGVQSGKLERHAARGCTPGEEVRH